MADAEQIELTVEAKATDILALLSEELCTLPLALIRRLVARGRVAVDGRRVARDFVPAPGQHVVVALPSAPIVRYEPEALDIEVRYEDAGVLAINKPVGLSVVPDPCRAEARLINGLLHYVQQESPQPCRRVYVVHRLDKETSGVLLFAKTPEAARLLSMAFERREVHKEYLAVVRGEVSQDEGEVEAAIGPGSGGRMRLTDKRGKPATSHYRVIERFRRFSLLQVEPLTGRTHQVRLHCLSIGHPLAVEPLYSGNHAIYLSEIKRNYRAKAGRPERPLIGRLTLHAHRIEVPRPEGVPLSVEAPIPADLERLLHALRKYAAK